MYYVLIYFCLAKSFSYLHGPQISVWTPVAAKVDIY